MWGQVAYFGNFSAFGEIIPTRVGTSVVGHNIAFDAKDHPHACGDKGLAELAEEGSSPRMWGQDAHKRGK